jgi:hypothetical protein
MYGIGCHLVHTLSVMHILIASHEYSIICVYSKALRIGTLQTIGLVSPAVIYYTVTVLTVDVI